MTKIWKRLIGVFLALILSFTPFFALSMPVNAIDPYAKQGLCITEIALGEEGYTEGPGNSNKYGWNAGWCAMFIGWCAEQAGILEIVPDKSSPQQYRSYYNGLGMYRAIDASFDPQVGDLLFTKGTFSSPDHISIVVETTDENVITMDGNWGDDGEGRVAKVTRAKTDSTIVAYVRPNYITAHVWSVGGINHLCECCGLNGMHDYVWTKSTTKHTGSCFCGKVLTENHIFPTSMSPCSACGYRPGDIVIIQKVPKKEELS